jgi:mono/diheme cytochrome c family protein
MDFRSLVLVSLFLAAPGVSLAQEKASIKYTQPEQISPTNGAEMFRAYCAVCHGTDGAGGGPAASALKKAPADLTQLSRKNGGKFPKLRVENVIQGADVVASHGSRDMPIWGVVFRSLGADFTVKLRVENLSNYIESLQRK